MEKVASLKVRMFAGEKTPAKASFLLTLKKKRNTYKGGSINFSYVLPPSVQQGLINVYNAYGQIIHSFVISKSEGIEIFNLIQQSQGLYFYSLFVNNTIIDKGKFTINK